VIGQEKAASRTVFLLTKQNNRYKKKVSYWCISNRYNRK